MSKKEKWNKLFDCQGLFYGEAPIALLKDYWQRLRKGKVLDLAMGEGRNAVFLAQKSFEVIGFDISTVAIEKAKKLAYDKGVKIETKVADLDLYVFPVFGFDSIILSYFKPPSRYYNEITRALAQGGTVLIEGYSIEQLMKDPLPELENQDYYAPNELLRNFKDLQILYYNEGETQGKHLVQCLAKKPTNKDAIKYGFVKGDINETKSRFKSAEDLFKK